MILFASLVGLGAMILTPKLQKGDNSLTINNVEALASLEEAEKECTALNGVCIMGGHVYVGIKLATD